MRKKRRKRACLEEHRRRHRLTLFAKMSAIQVLSRRGLVHDTGSLLVGGAIVERLLDHHGAASEPRPHLEPRMVHGVFAIFTHLPRILAIDGEVRICPTATAGTGQRCRIESARVTTVAADQTHGTGASKGYVLPWRLWLEDLVLLVDLFAMFFWRLRLKKKKKNKK